MKMGGARGGRNGPERSLRFGRMAFGIPFFVCCHVGAELFTSREILLRCHFKPTSLAMR